MLVISYTLLLMAVCNFYCKQFSLSRLISTRIALLALTVDLEWSFSVVLAH
jgi:hypothetical protein